MTRTLLLLLGGSVAFAVLAVILYVAGAALALVLGVAAVFAVLALAGWAAVRGALRRPGQAGPPARSP